METVLTLLENYARRTPNGIAARMSLQPDKTLSYRTLLHQSQRTGAFLSSQFSKEDRIVLLFDNSFAFFSAFLGSLYAQMIPVPLSPPSPTPHRLSAELSKLQWVCQDSGAKAIFTHPTIKTQLELAQSAFSSTLNSNEDDLRLPAMPTLISPNDINNDNALPCPSPRGSDIAFLQYTSGSTGRPKGVMISHNNLISNTTHIIQQLERIESAVTWVPCHHDLGIMSALFMPLYLQIPSHLLTPRDFMTHPISWLNAISNAPPCYTASPNFAYELCCRKINDSELPALDLSRWRYAGCGAEKNQIHTLQRFTKKFGPCGFQSHIFSPAYGLAEHTVCVSGLTESRDPIKHALQLDKTALSHHQVKASTKHENARASLSHGQAFDKHLIVIVNPDSCAPCPANTIGEIWCQGPSIALGYWNNDTLTEHTFHAVTKDGEGPFLRTGDLGFLHHNELHITGRIKDTIIVHGNSYTAEDIEWTMQQAHPALRPGNLCVFSVLDGEQENTVLLAEVRPQKKSHFQDIFHALNSQSLTQIGIHLDTLVLLRPNSLHKTTSGKIQRQKNKKAFTRDSLPFLVSQQHPNRIQQHTEQTQLAEFFLLQDKDAP